LNKALIMFATEFRNQSVIRLNENTPRIEKCLALLTEAQVWQQPNTSTNSIANLILHLCGNITQYVISSLGQQPDIRQRSLEFSTTEGYDKAALLRKLQSTVAQASQVIEACSEEELLRLRNVQGFELTGIGIIIHVVEHYSYHTGQIALWTKLLRDQDLGFYAGMDLEVGNE